MVSYLSCLLFALCLLFLTADGRKMEVYVEGINNVTTSSSSLVNSTNYSTSTHPNDVKGLIVLVDAFPQLSGVQFPSISKDPCYPPHKLTWISCTSDPIRRVTALYLGNKNLHGPIPDFSSMDALQTIDLHGNYLSGPIPGFFRSFPMLKYLNLANNSVTVQLLDSVPNTKKIKSRRSLAAGTAPSYCANNPYVCTCIYPYTCAPPTPVYSYIPPPTSGYQYPMPGFNYGGGSGYGKSKPSKLPKILAISIPSGLVATICGGGCCYACRRNRH
ncbi:hypothetical protein ABFS82_14G249200 [Erythranthe guttata]